MASRSNPYQRDPALAQAFNNISAMFAPPSGGDAAGFATAAAKKAEAERLAWLFQNSADPTASARAALTGVQGYGQTPAGFMQTDLTNRRGQDVTAATARRGQDITADTTLRTNAADNTRASVTSLYGALSPGAVRPAVPAEVAATVGLPALPEVVGSSRPQTLDQWQAQQAEELKRGGTWTPDMTIDVIMGKQTPVEALGPDGKPRFMSPGAAVRMGAQPAPDPAKAGKLFRGVLPGGQQVPVEQRPDGLYHAQTGQRLPPEVQLFNVPTPTGTGEQVGLPTTANNTAANNQTAEVTRALSVLDLYEQLVNENPGSIGLVGAIRGTAQNLAASAGDLAKSFGARAPQLTEAATALQSGLRGVAPQFFDPAIPQAEFLQGTLAYALARTENPSGEVSRQAFERALERVKGGGLLANTPAAKAAIAANRQVLQSQLRGIETLRGQQPGRTDPSFQPPPPAPGAMSQQPVASERWERGPDGNLRKVQ